MIHATNHEHSAAKANAHSPDHIPGRRIVVIDDNPIDRSAIHKMVCKANSGNGSVVSFASLNEALASSQLYAANLILLDDHLTPNETAEISLKKLRNAGVRCPAIVVSGLASKKRDRMALRHGAVQYASKNDLDKTSMRRLIAYGLAAAGLWNSSNNST